MVAGAANSTNNNGNGQLKGLPAGYRNQETGIAAASQLVKYDTPPLKGLPSVNRG